MGIFSSIKDKIFGGDEEEKKAPVASSTASVIKAATKAASEAVTSAAQPISGVDVEAKLDAMSGADGLNWRSSIVDLMRLVGLDPSYGNRKELAIELGDNDYSGTAEENIWLHKQVMTKLAQSGGMVPADLRD